MQFHIQPINMLYRIENIFFVKLEYVTFYLTCNIFQLPICFRQFIEKDRSNVFFKIYLAILNLFIADFTINIFLLKKL